MIRGSALRRQVPIPLDAIMRASTTIHGGGPAPRVMTP